MSYRWISISVVGGCMIAISLIQFERAGLPQVEVLNSTKYSVSTRQADNGTPAMTELPLRPPNDKTEGQTFGCFGPASCYYAENGVVYYESFVLLDADPRTFVLLEFPYSKDARHVYYLNTPLPDVSPASFSVLDASGYGYDGNHVFYENKLVAGADPTTFRTISKPENDDSSPKCGPVCGIHVDAYGADQTSVFYGDNRLQGVAPGRVSFIRPGCLQYTDEIFYKYQLVGQTSGSSTPVSLCELGAEELDI
jgi:hypothetical protein